MLAMVIVKPVNHWNLLQSNYSRPQKHTVVLISFTSDRFSGRTVNSNQTIIIIKKCLAIERHLCKYKKERSGHQVDF